MCKAFFGFTLTREFLVLFIQCKSFKLLELRRKITDDKSIGTNREISFR